MTPEAAARSRLRNLALWDPPAASPGEVVRRLVAVQAQEHRHARWSVAQRSSSGLTALDVDGAFDRGELLRTHVLRPTWHFVAPEDLRWLLELSGPVVEARMARRHEELELDARTIDRAVEVIGSAVADGPLTRHDLAERLEGRGIATAGQRLPHLLMVAELRSVVCSGPRRGKQHTYADFDQRVPPAAPRDRHEALAELARRYVATRGPVTERDLRWWSGLSAADGRAALAAAGAVREEIDGRTYWHDGSPAPRRRHHAELLQCYDEAVVSYTESRGLLQGGEGVLAGRTAEGFLHPVVHGTAVVGRWRVAKDGTVETRVTADAPVDGAVARYERFLSA
jgi:hypothetical protein